MSEKRLYIILSSLCTIGYIWVALHIFAGSEHEVVLCLFKRVTSIPCPACGTTRSVIHIMAGDLHQAILVNPLGYLVLLGLFVLPFWLFYDLIFHKSSLNKLFNKINELGKRKGLMILFIILMISNWIWNISKDL